MAGLARRLAPAAALGGLAVVIVGVADPAIAALRGAEDVPETAVPVAAAQAATTGDTSTSDTSTSDTSTSDTAVSCDSGQTVSGDTVTTRWGPVQVEATVAGSQICEVHAVNWPSGDGRSQMISAYAIPQLDQAATASHGTQLDYISGATYTSNGYAQSLQSILDSL